MRISECGKWDSVTWGQVPTRQFCSFKEILYISALKMNKKKNTLMMKRIIPLLLLCLCFTTAFSKMPTDRLFQIDRSKNANIVCYDVKLENDHLDLEHPMEVYWIRHEEGGIKKDLSLLQRRLAYGYKVVEKGQNEASIRLTAYKKQSIRICKRGGQWVALVTIQGQECILSSIYVQAKPQNSLSVEYVELHGKTLKGGKTVSEKLFPD